MRKFTVVLTPGVESGGYAAIVPALPGCVTDGETIEDALERVQDVISLYLQDEDDLNPVESSTGLQVLIAEVMVV